MDNKTMAQHHGVVFTRVPVVEFMLDLVGYHPDERLHTLRCNDLHRRFRP